MRRVLVIAGIVVGVVAFQVAVGRLLAYGSRREAAIVFAGFAAIVVSLRSPSWLGVAVFPAVYLNRRLGVGGLDLSYADAALVAGFGACIYGVPWNNPWLKRLALVFVGYVVILLLAVMTVPTERAVLELGHRAFLVLGAICVGGAVARAGASKFALQLYVLASTAVALEAIRETLASDGFVAAHPWEINKNAGGILIAMAIVVLVVAREHVGLWRPLGNLILAALFGGMLACQSRGAAAALGIVLVLSVVRLRKRHLLVPLLGVIALGVMAQATLEQENEDEVASQFNSVNVRVATYEETFELWREHEIAGVGIRFWNDPTVTGTYAGGEPHNLFISALGETGVIGAIGVSWFIIGSWWVLRKRNDTLGVCARYVVIAQVVSGLADIYWRAGTGTLPWLIVGLAIVHGEEADDDAIVASEPTNALSVAVMS